VVLIETGEFSFSCLRLLPLRNSGRYFKMKTFIPQAHKLSSMSTRSTLLARPLHITTARILMDVVAKPRIAQVSNNRILFYRLPSFYIS
jgi:hypothetical protein